jgi:hypothetical protein
VVALDSAEAQAAIAAADVKAQAKQQAADAGIYVSYLSTMLKVATLAVVLVCK